MSKPRKDKNKSKADVEGKKESKEPPETNITHITNITNITNINTSESHSTQPNKKQGNCDKDNTNALSADLKKLTLDEERSNKKSIGAKVGKKGEKQNEEQIEQVKKEKTDKNDSKKNNQKSNIDGLGKKKKNEDKDKSSELVKNRRCMIDGIIRWTIDDIKFKNKRSSKVEMEFYTSELGYHLRLNGYFNGKKKDSDCLAVYFQIIKGDFDDDKSVTWPFKHDVTFKLINQSTGKVLGNNIETKTCDPNKTPKAYEKPIKENDEIGYHTFVKMDDLLTLADKDNDKIVIEFSLAHVVKS